MKTRLILALAAVLVVLGVVYVLTRPEPEEPEPEPPKVWSFDFLELARVEIALPGRDLAEAWSKGEDKQWYFEPDGPQVSRSRWGGGVPLILAGPRASRAIASEATDEQMATYGLAEPRMLITIGTESDERVQVEIGDRTPVGDAYYFVVSGTRDVYTIDYSWYEVLERLVTEPPYPAHE